MAQTESHKSKLSSLRAKFKDELFGDENSDFLIKILALTIAEVGESSAEAQRAVLETLMNRSDAYGRSLEKEYSGGYYAPVNTNSIERQIKRIENNEALREKIKDRLDEVFAGSNDSNFAMHNGSAGVAKKAQELGDVRKVINYGSGNETFYNKSKDDGANYYGAGIIKREMNWVNQFGIEPPAFPDTRPPLSEPTSYSTNMSTGYGGDTGYPVLEEKVESVTGAVAGTAVNLATRFFPGRVESAVSGVLSQSLGDIPQVATLAKEIVGPGLQGGGIPTITSAISRISAPDTLAGRIQESISLAQENRELVKVLAPQFESLLDFDQMGAFDRLRAIYTAAEESNVKIDALEQLDQTLQKTSGIVTPLETILFNPTEGSDLIKAYAPGILSENVNQQNKTFEGINNILGRFNKEYAEYGELAGNLTKPIDEILQNPQIQTMLESLPQLDPLRGTSEEVQERLGEMAVSEIAGEIGLGKADTRTLVLGSENPEEVKKLRESAGGLVLDDFIESNPTLKAIIDFFTNNKEIITLLGTTGAVAGLSSLLGGGMFGGFAAGAGAFAATRIALGEDGFNELQSMIKVAGEPVFNFVDEMLKSSGLSEIPVLGDVLTQISTIGRGNPLALATGLTGNFGGAAGLLAASAVTDFFDSDNSISDIFEYINAPAIPSYDYGFVGNGRMPMYPDYSGNQSLPRGAQGEPMQGGTNVTGLYVPGIHTNANDLGSHNTGSLLGAAGSQ